MCLSVVGKDFLYLWVEFNSVLQTCLLNYLETAERLDRSLEELVSLKTYDKLVFLVDIAGCM